MKGGKIASGQEATGKIKSRLKKKKKTGTRSPCRSAEIVSFKLSIETF